MSWGAWVRTSLRARRTIRCRWRSPSGYGCRQKLLGQWEAPGSDLKVQRTLCFHRRWTPSRSVRNGEPSCHEKSNGQAFGSRALNEHWPMIVSTTRREGGLVGSEPLRWVIAHPGCDHMLLVIALSFSRLDLHALYVLPTGQDGAENLRRSQAAFHVGSLGGQGGFILETAVEGLALLGFWRFCWVRECVASPHRTSPSG